MSAACHPDNRPDGMSVAAWCDQWFPEEGHSYGVARLICQGCSQREQCLEANLLERDGMWGGLTPRQRRALAREMRRPTGQRALIIERSAEVARLARMGLVDRQIAQRMGLPVRTVRDYRKDEGIVYARPQGRRASRLVG